MLRAKTMMKAVTIGFQILTAIESFLFDDKAKLDLDPITVRRHGHIYTLHVTIRKNEEANDVADPRN